MTDHTPLPPVIDADQLRRIESTHRGFFYQHLFAVGCLLVAQRSGVKRIIVERDEDVELEHPGQRIYVQVKTRSSQLQWSDISSTLDDFARIRTEHSSGSRTNLPAFYIVCNVASSNSLRNRYVASDWPNDVRMFSPTDSDRPDFLPPVWPDISVALAWCREQAEGIPFLTVAGDVLVWKLAAMIQYACTGEGAHGHFFSVEDLPALFSQVIIQLQGFPDSSRPYLPHTDEPPYLSDSRIRAIIGLSGSGKTAWVAEAAAQMPDAAIYFDIGDTPALALAAGIVRETAGLLFKDDAETRSAILLPGYSGLDALRVLDRLLAAKNQPISIFVDNCQRCSAESVFALASSTTVVRWVFVSQPCPEQVVWVSRLGLKAEELIGWNADSIANRFKASEMAVDYPNAEIVRSLTGGLPIFVQSIVSLTKDHYAGDVSRCCKEVANAAHGTITVQDVIIGKIQKTLSADVKSVVITLSQSEVPISLDELKALTAVALQLNERLTARCVRELHAWGVVQFLGKGEVLLHDAFRPMAAELLAEVSSDTVYAIKSALKDMLVKSLIEEADYQRQLMLIRLLPLIGETVALVELASSRSEYLRELGLIPEVSVVLRRFIDQDASPASDKFWALDTLALWANDEKELAVFDGLKDQMQALYDSAGLGPKERAALATKRLLTFGRRGDTDAILEEMRVVQDVIDDDPEHRRILVYDCASALFYAKKYTETADIARSVAGEYFEELGFRDGLASENLPQIWEGIKKTDETQDNLKRLADCLELLAMAKDRLDQRSFPARLHAHKFYILAGAFRSAMRVGQDCADELLRFSNSAWEARNFIEQSLLKAITKYKLLEYVIPVRSQYAVVAAYCGDVALARKEIKALLDFDIPDDERRAEVQRQAELIEQIANGYNPYLERQRAIERLHSVPRLQLPDPYRVARVGRNDPCPCGSGIKFKKCCLRR